MSHISALVLVALSLSSFASPAFAGLLIKVDKSTQTLTVIRDGRTLNVWPVSTGKTNHATPSGSFTAFRMEADHFSKEWDDAPMPHSIFFTRQGHAIHGSFDVKRLGSPASHGCVRLAPANAAALFDLVRAEGLPNTQVLLTGSEQVALNRVNAQRAALPLSGRQPNYAPPGYFEPHQNGHPAPGYIQRGYGGNDPQPQLASPQRHAPRVAQSQPYVPRTDTTRPPGLVYADPYDGTLRYIPR